jgi:hypothetical protein
LVDTPTRALKVADKSAAAVNTQARQSLAKTYSMLGLIALHMEKPGVAATHLSKPAAEFEELERVQPNPHPAEVPIPAIHSEAGCHTLRPIRTILFRPTHILGDCEWDVL